MKKKIWIPILIIIIIIVGIILIVQNKNSNQIDENKEPIKIGVLMPLTGVAASVGQDMKNAIELALEKINQKNEIIELIIEDEKCNANDAISGYNSLLLKGVKTIIGPGCSPSALAVAPLAEKDGIIIITPSASADTLSDSGDFIFRNHTLSSQKTGKLGEFAAKKFNSLATIYDKSNDSFVLSESFLVDKFENSDKKILIREGFEKNSTDFKTQLTKIKDKKPEVIYIGSVMPQLALIVKQINELGINSQIIMDDSATDAKFLEAVGDLSENIIFGGPDFNYDINPEFWDSYNQKFGKNPNTFAAQAYDCLVVLANIIKKECKSGNSICIKDELYKIKDYQGVSGIITFDKNGDALRPIVIKTIKNGQFVPYEE